MSKAVPHQGCRFVFCGAVGEYVSEYINNSLVLKNASEVWDVSLSGFGPKFTFRRSLYRGRHPFQRELDCCPQQGKSERSWDLWKGIFRLLGDIQGISLTETLLALGQEVDSVEV